MSTPPRAARASPARTAAGVEIANAHGDAPINMLIARRNASFHESHPNMGGNTIATMVVTALVLRALAKDAPE